MDAKLAGDRRMVRAYNRHGRESGRVVQVTCDTEVVVEFLRLMRRACIYILPPGVDPVDMLPYNAAKGEERISLLYEHLAAIHAQWK